MLVLLTLANSQMSNIQMLVGLPAVSGLLLGHANNIIKWLGKSKCMATIALEKPSLEAQQRPHMHICPSGCLHLLPDDCCILLIPDLCQKLMSFIWTFWEQIRLLIYNHCGLGTECILFSNFCFSISRMVDWQKM